MRPLSVLCVAGVALSLHGQDVLVDVQVLRKGSNTPVPSLQAKDLRILEDGVPQQIRHFSRDELPLSVVLLLDLSGTGQGALKRLSEEAKTALDHLKPQDEVAVMFYGETARLVDGFSRDRERTARAIADAAGMKSDEGAYSNEAVYQAAMQLRRCAAPSCRPLIVWLTDNIPTVPNARKPVHSEDQAIRALHEGGVVVAPMLLKDTGSPPLIGVMSPILGRMTKPRPWGDARKYAESTGGQAVGLRGKSPAERLGEMIDELRARYTVGYRPAESKPTGTFCKLLVELAPGGALRPNEWVVFARQGYYRK